MQLYVRGFVEQRPPEILKCLEDDDHFSHPHTKKDLSLLCDPFLAVSEKRIAERGRARQCKPCPPPRPLFAADEIAYFQARRS